MLLTSSSLLLLLLLSAWPDLGSCTAAVPPKPTGFSYLGCYADGDNSNRDLLGLGGLSSFGPFATHTGDPVFVYLPAMTLQLCSQICSYGRFRYFGVQANSYCSCDFTFGSFGASAEGDCSAACWGNSSQVCGGWGRNSICEISYSPATPKMVKLAASSMPSISASASSITHWSQQATVAFECLAACHRSPHCLACAFVQPSRMCRLMRFAAVPSEIASEAQWFWVKP